MIKSIKSLSELPVVYCNGLLYVGDPHLTERAPSRRLDEDYTATILDKLMQVQHIANEKDYCVVILGDMFDNATEFKKRMMTGLFRFLSGLKHPCYCLAGNHDLDETVLKESATLSVVESTGLCHIIKDAGMVAVFKMGGKTVALGGTPSGQEIPDKIPLAEKPLAACDNVIWLTHEDLAFPGAYPSALPFKEIEGCNLVVNGHMHALQPEKIVGQTTWFNPGNIIRKTIKDKDHRPAVYSWHPDAGLVRHQLKYKTDVFDLTGHHVAAADEDTLIESLKLEDLSQSQFADLLKNEFSDNHKTDDGGILSELFERSMKDYQLSPSSAHTIKRLMSEALAGVDG